MALTLAAAFEWVGDVGGECRKEAFFKIPIRADIRKLATN